MEKTVSLDVLGVVVWVGVMFVLGLGYQESVALLFGTTIVLVQLIWRIYTGGTWVFPKLLLPYFGFLGIFLVTIWWSVNQTKSFLHWLLYASFPLVWLLATTHLMWLKKHLSTMMLWLGVLWAGMALLTHTLPAMKWLKVTPRGLVGMYSITADHYMLGDYWGVLLALLLYELLVKKQKWVWPFVSLGMAIVLFSLSRSALLGFVVALAVLFARTFTIRLWWKQVFWGFVIVATLYMGTQKSLLFNRPYYFQAVAGLFTYPFGIGVANFEKISEDPAFHFLGMSGFSRVTHSIFLEFLSGMGVLGVSFLGWCFLVYRYYFVKRELDGYYLALVALVVDMVFNPTYFVTPMLWLLAALLPLVNSQEEKKSGWLLGGLTALTAVVFLMGGMVAVTI